MVLRMASARSSRSASDVARHAASGHHRRVGGGIGLGQVEQLIATENRGIAQVAQLRLMVGCVRPADGELGNHGYEGRAHRARQRRSGSSAGDGLAAGQLVGQLAQGKVGEAGCRVLHGEVSCGSPRRLYGLDSRPMADGGWRIVLISTVPIIAQLMTETLRGLGHRPMAVITARRDRPRPDQPAMTDESAPPGLDVLLPATKHSIEPLLRAYDPDLVLCWGFPWKIPLGALQVPRLGSVNCHPALLPRHRGPIPFAWALREGDGQYGVTWHRMDAELDTGPILAQATVPMEDDDFEITVVGPRIAPIALGLLPRVLERVAAGDPGDPQPLEGRQLGRPLRRGLRHGRLGAAGPQDPRPGPRLGLHLRALAGDRADRRAGRQARAPDAHQPGRPWRRRATGRGWRRPDLGGGQRARRGLGRLVERLHEPASIASVEDQRGLAGVRLQQERDAWPALGGIGGCLVADGLEAADGQLPVAHLDGEGPGVAPVPAHARRHRRDLGECHRQFAPSRPRSPTEQAF